MELFHIGRLMLYVLEWIWNTAVMGLAASKLKGVVGGFTVCTFGRLSNCNWVLAWSIISFVLLSICIIWYGAKYWSSFSLPPQLELIFFAASTFFWFVTACVVSANHSLGGGATVALTWMLVFFCIGSTVIAYMDGKDSSTTSMNEPQL
uniref:MARVEL domain-containing protein n=1 Tax=Compsopogon caeruleus TaxID=31354 RepID=A0A7S1T6Z4_9RHOD|mmetsp:Transcript_11486/g.23363  ORF Transcript_11486/g.23363 Transcript_11486/m.23363 type:complete len:149 (+) Transcript_11486:95-541(+)